MIVVLGQSSQTIDSTSTIYAILVHQSRTSQERHYRLFDVSDNELKDVTFPLCAITGELWDDKRDTLVRRGNDPKADASEVQTRLMLATNWNGTVELI